MSEPKFVVVIDAEDCKGCSLCIDFCPRNVLELVHELNRMGYHPACAVRVEDCSGCQACAQMCPEGGVTIYRRKVAEKTPAA
jgi:2-oxoglutarate ferredoxin oxidoreductase subunit delta